MLVLIKGAGDLASGVAHRFHQCGIPVVMTEIAQPTTVRCTVAFSRAVYEGSAEIEGVTARLADTVQSAVKIVQSGDIAVIADPAAKILNELPFDAVIDAVIAKSNLGTTMHDAPTVVALGPGFTAGIDCHAVVETKRGHNLGRVFYEGSAAPNTGVPGNIGGFTTERIIRAPQDGLFVPIRQIGDLVKKGEPVAQVGGTPVFALLDGVVRGMLPAGTPVVRGLKSGDIDPRGIPEYCRTISDKARAIGGGALEAVLFLKRRKEHAQGIL
ncbi:MAG: EF2563 family selenium-dependent molybdenum hydroxylase system protein [Ruminococcaceae bacterium]|jgi:xanthine dehydrogenase accessory factor|nr:EF2563 family selenium-dependent molybdenum hydroxylase system protein [Oscillospiraceae bacterium]